MTKPVFYCKRDFGGYIKWLYISNIFMVDESHLSEFEQTYQNIQLI